MANRPTITFENATIRFLNFSGNEGRFNKAGDRNFCLFLDPETATNMIEDGYNIKQLKAREEGDTPQDYIQIAVSYKNRPPRVVMITSKGRKSLNEDKIDILDWADIANVDLIINPSEWEVSGKSGVKAYLKSLFVTLEEDELDLKYADVPDSARNTEVPNNDEE